MHKAGLKAVNTQRTHVPKWTVTEVQKQNDAHKKFPSMTQLNKQVKVQVKDLIMHNMQPSYFNICRLYFIMLRIHEAPLQVYNWRWETVKCFIIYLSHYYQNIGKAL